MRRRSRRVGRAGHRCETGFAFCASLAAAASCIFGMCPARGEITTLPSAFATAPVEGNKLDWGVSQEVGYDDNLYRSSVADAPRLPEDVVSRTSVGATASGSLQRQLVTFDVRVDDNQYRYHQGLDNISGLGKLTWAGLVGTRATAELSAELSRFLTSFVNSPFRGKDLISTADYGGSLRYELGPRWSIGAVGTLGRTYHSDEFRRDDDTKNRTGAVGIRYESRSANSIEWSLRHDQTDFSFAPLAAGNVGFDRTYAENAAHIAVKYALTDITQVSAQTGYVRRDYLAAPGRAYSGTVWRASVRWQPEGRMQLTMEGWRDLDAYIDSQSDYYIGQGVDAQLQWSLMHALTGSAVLSRETQTYVADALQRDLVAPRHDVVKVGQAQLTYASGRRLEIMSAYRFERRATTRPGYDYDDNSVSLRVTIKF